LASAGPALLKAGRAELSSPDGRSVALRTDAAVVSGDGRAVVRSDGATTWVCVFEGRVRVDAAAEFVSLREGQGVIVRAGEPPSQPLALPAAPEGLFPGDDPVFVPAGEPLRLEWRAGGAPLHQVEVLPMHAEDRVVSLAAPGRSIEVRLHDLGMFRWRVSAHDDLGLESAPSREGLFVVVGFDKPRASSPSPGSVMESATPGMAPAGPASPRPSPSVEPSAAPVPEPTPTPAAPAL
jgi:hypothetical protein